MKKIILIISFIFIYTISCAKQNSIVNEAISINMGPEPKTLDPTLNSLGSASCYILHAFEGLTKMDSNNTVQPGIAERWDISDDGLTYTFHLRTNALWSDGTNVKAKDFEYSWKRSVNPSVAAEYAYMMEIVQNAKEINEGTMDYNELAVKAIDDYTFEVTLANPSPYFLEFIASTGIFMPLREDIINTYGDEWTLKPETYIVNGAYTMTERLADEKIVFSANKNYYNPNEQVAKKINFVLMSEPNTAMSGIKSSSIHFSALEPPSSEIASLKTDNLLVENNAIGTYFIELNITNNALRDKRVRQALSLAIDRNYLVLNVTKGGQAPAGAFIPPTIKGSNSTFRVENQEYINNKTYLANVEKAKRLMAEAGYPNGKDFPVLELKVSPGIYVLLGETIQQMWRDNLNVYIKLLQEEFPVTLQTLVDKNYEMARMGWTGDYNDPMTMLEIMLSYSGINHTGFSNADFDNLINIAKTSADNDVRMNAMKEAEAILMDEMPIIPLYYRTDLFMVNPILKNVVLSPLGRHKFNYCYIEVTKKTNR